MKPKKHKITKSNNFKTKSAWTPHKFFKFKISGGREIKKCKNKKSETLSKLRQRPGKAGKDKKIKNVFKFECLQAWDDKRR